MLLRGQITLAVLALVVFVIGFVVSSARDAILPKTLPHVSATFEPAPETPLSYSPPAVLEHVPSVKQLLATQSSQERLVEELVLPELQAARVQIEYTFDPLLSQEVETILEQAQAQYAHILVSDPKTGRLLAYASTDREKFSPTQVYPAASLVKVVTTAAAMRHAPDALQRECRYQGSPYRLTPTRVDPPTRGSEVSFQKALGMSNNQCFAQLAVHAVGADALIATIREFGLLDAPALGHAAGRISFSSMPMDAPMKLPARDQAEDPEDDTAEDRYELGELGSGLSGLRITPLHAVQLAATLSDGMMREPYWIAKVTNAQGKLLSLPPLQAPKQVLSEDEAARLRAMMVETTQRGTARRAFHARNGRMLLDPVRVAGKTGSLSGTNPTGRYEWFIGVAPAEAPTIAVAVVVVQGEVWHRSASQMAAQVLSEIFCPRGVCDAKAATRLLPTGFETRVVQKPVPKPRFENSPKRLTSQPPLRRTKPNESGRSVSPEVRATPLRP